MAESKSHSYFGRVLGHNLKIENVPTGPSKLALVNPIACVHALSIFRKIWIGTHILWTNTRVPVPKSWTYFVSAADSE